jgi:ectoine hydroxylase
MRLDEAQIAEYDCRGLLFFSALLQEAETAELQTGLTDILNRAGPEIIREKEDPAAVRLAFGAHVYSEPFGRLIRHPDILRPVRQLLQDEVYLHQSRVNPKQGFAGGAAWDWHQDFPGWHYADGMPEPRCVMVAVFIDDCTSAT